MIVEWLLSNTATTLTVSGLTIDNTAPSTPSISLTSSGGKDANHTYYQNSVTYTVTAGSESAGSGVQKTTYTYSGAGTSNSETNYSSAVKVSASSYGTVTMTAYTYDKAGNRSSKTLTNSVCGSHDKAQNSLKSSATCTAAQVRYYRCSRCYVTNGTYTSGSKLGHYNNNWYGSCSANGSTLKCARCNSSTYSKKTHILTYGTTCKACAQNVTTSKSKVTW